MTYISFQALNIRFSFAALQIQASTPKPISGSDFLVRFESF
jgi:hypothetical protein